MEKLSILLRKTKSANVTNYIVLSSSSMYKDTITLMYYFVMMFLVCVLGLHYYHHLINL